MPQDQLRQHHRPLWLGALAAAFAPALCLFALSSTLSPYRSTMDSLHTLLFFLLVSVPVSLLALVALGLPLVLWLRAHRLLTVLSTCVASTAIGVLVFAALAWALAWDHSSPDVQQLLAGACLGLASGAAFSLGAGLPIRPGARRTDVA